MDFTPFIWSLYVGSPEGQKALSKSPQEFAPLGWDVVLPVYEGDDQESPTGLMVECDVVAETRRWCESRSVSSLKEATALFEQIVDNDISYCPEGDASFRSYVFESDSVFNLIQPLSLGLHLAFPEYFIPFFFRRNFAEFDAICQAFKIPIASPPTKLQKRERSLYYGALNDALQEFRQMHGLTPRELMAFLYDFAPTATRAEEDKELPPPKSVWYSIAGTWDFEGLDAATPDTTKHWNGNLEARRGDVVLMYCVAPRSHIGSIWRVTHDGYAAPFFHYYSEIRIGHCQKMEPTHISELRAHPTISQNGTVRGSFKGANGRRVPQDTYIELLQFFSTKGLDVSAIPIPSRNTFEGSDRFKLEVDVEKLLIEPLLQRLGYKEVDWLRQMPVRMGHSERNFPDYSILPNPKRGEESAAFIIEAKLEIATEKQRDKAFLQTKSYALRVQARLFVLAAKEGIWIYKRSDGFSRKAFQKWSWQELEKPDNFQRVSVLLEKRAHLTF